MDAKVISTGLLSFTATSQNNQNTDGLNADYCNGNPKIGDYLAYSSPILNTYCVKDFNPLAAHKYVCVYDKDS